MDVLVFACGDGLYALESSRAAEVVTPASLTSLPGAKSHVRGVFAHRGEVVPVIDLAALFGAGPQADLMTPRAVLLRTQRGPYAVLTTRVLGVESHDVASEPVGTGGLGAAVRPPIERDGEVLTVLDVEGLFELLAEGR